MTQLYQRNPTHHVLLARQFSGGNGPHDGGPGANSPPPRTGTTAPGNSNRGENGPSDSSSISASSSPTSTDSSLSSTPVPSTSLSESLTSSDPTPSSASSSSVQSASSTPPVDSSTTSSLTSAVTSASISKIISTPSSSSTSLSTSQSTSSVIQQTPATSFTNPIVNTDQITPTPSVSYGTQPDPNAPVSTVSASAVSSTSSNLSAGNIVGIVVGTLIGLALLVILVAFVLRRYRRSRRRAMRDSDFGTTFRRSMFVTPRSSSAPTTGGMSEIGHNVAPSLKEPYVPYSGTVKPPSQTLAAATSAATLASGGGLQERPKYVYGQDPTATGQQHQEQEQQQQQHDDTGSDTHGGAYSSQPQVQGAYDAEAYGSYAKYEDFGDGVVGGVPAGTAVYQDAQRAYQGQQGYDQSHYDPAHYASYNQPQYRGYGQQQQAYGYSGQHSQEPQAYVKGSNGGVAY